jgi:hypothetical protein
MRGSAVNDVSCRTGALRGQRSLRDMCWASRGAPDGRNPVLRQSAGYAVKTA